MEQEQKTGLIFQLLPKVMAQVGAVGKERKNEQQGYKFRGIDEIYFAVQPAMIANGIFVVPEVVSNKREERTTRDGKGTLTYTILTVRHTFYAPDGSSVQCVMMGEAMDSGDKSSNKAMSAAMKYALIETFCIPTQEPIDTENQTHETSARPARRPSTGETVNRQTGEVGSAPTAASMMSISEAEALSQLIDTTFEQRGFDPPTADRILIGALKKFKFPNIKVAGKEWAEKFIGNIESGMYDKMKPAAVAVGAA